ncbi:MAG: PQQ-binding-like beta-propeller repeat protein, partial [Planctomycetota bacterium]
MAYLDIRRDGEPAQAVALSAEEVTAIGRHPACAVRLVDGGVPDIAARVTFDGASFRVAAGPDAAVRVNGDRVEAGPLRESDLIQIGRYQIRFREGEADAGGERVVLEALDERPGKSRKRRPSGDGRSRRRDSGDVRKTASRRDTGAQRVVPEASADDLPVAVPLSQLADNADVVVESERPDREKPPSRRGRTRPGDEDLVRSPSLLILTGTTAALLVAGVALYFVIGRESARGLLVQADADFDAGRYAAAITGYETFLIEYPGDSRKVKARLRLGISRVERAASAANPDFEAAAEELSRVAEDARGEGRFDDVRAALLDSAEAVLASAAEDATGSGLTDDLDAAERVAAVYGRLSAGLPEPRERAAGLEAAMARAREAVRVAGRVADVATSVDALRDAGDFRGGHRQLDALLRTERLTAEQTASATALRDGLVTAEAAGVASLAADGLPVAAAGPDPSTYVSPMPTFAATNIAAAGGSPVVVAGRDTVYGLDPANGRVVWERPAGGTVPIDPIVVPGMTEQAVVAEQGGEVLALIRVADGSAVWRLGLSGPVAGPPLIDGDVVFAVVDGRELWRIDLGSGAVTARVAFPDELAVAPAVTGDGRFLIAVGRDDLTFTLDPETLERIAVTHTAQADVRDAVPLGAGRVVLWIDRVGPAVLRAFLVGDDGTLAEAGSLPVGGPAGGRPDVWGDVVFVPGVGGRVTAVRVTDADVGATLTKLAVSDASATTISPTQDKAFDESATRITVASGPTVWAAAATLQAMRLEAGVFDFVGRPISAGTHVASAVLSERRVVTTQLVGPGGRLAFAAVDRETRRPLWETREASPLVAVLPIEAGHMLVNEAGERFRVRDESFAARKEVAFVDRVPGYDAATHGRLLPVPTSAGTSAFASTGDEVALWLAAEASILGPYAATSGRPIRARRLDDGGWAIEIAGDVWRTEGGRGRLVRS